jgi:GNAT superfamily N-acetyltransferase
MIEIKTYNPASGEDFLPLMEAGNNTWPDFKRTLDEVERDYFMHRKDKFKQGFLLEDGGRPVAIAIAMEAYWVGDVSPLFLEVNLFPGVKMKEAEPLVEHLESLAKERGDPVQQVELCDIYRDVYEYWLDRGYESKMDGFVTRLDVQQFDSTGVAEGLRKFADSGMKLVPLTDLPYDNEDFQRRAYDLRWEINQDIPSTDTPQREPFERFVEMWISGAIVPRECFFFAVAEDGELTGYTNGRPLKGMPEKFDTFTTGVARAHRRKGVATALKVRIIEWCRDNGYRWIDTGNEKDNPMYDLNLALGFERWCNFCVLEKPVV